MDRDDYKTQLSTTMGGWIPQELYGLGTLFISYNTSRILNIEATTAGVSGGGTNPDGTFWGDPFTQWLLSKAQIGSTFLDGSVMWTVVAVRPFEIVAPLPTVPKYPSGDPKDDFYQNPAIGGTPVGFINYIDPTRFEPLIHREWDLFESVWMEDYHMTQPLYAVEIIFNARILLAGQGAIPPFMTGTIPQFNPFTGHRFVHVLKEIGVIADRLGIRPVTVKNAMQQLPNLVYITSPHFPKPGQVGPRERGGRFSNL